MKLFVDRLKERESPTPLRFEEPASWWAGGEGASSEPLTEAMDLSLRGPLVFEFVAHFVRNDLLLEGAFSGEVEADCARCLARYRERLHDEFQLLLEPAGDREPEDPEAKTALAEDGVCLGEDLGAGWFRGHELKLDAFLSEVVALALPVQPLCAEDCKGLCPQCGTELNVRSCECEVRERPSPFAALATLRDSLRDPTD